MNEEELDEIERTLKTSKPYNELGTYNYFNCESIEKLLKQNTELKEENFKLQARSDRFINYWNKLKEWLKEEIIKLELYKDNIDIDEYVDKKSLLKKVLEKLQEIEGGMNE